MILGQIVSNANDSLAAAAVAMPEGVPLTNSIIGIVSTLSIVALTGIKVYGEWINVRKQREKEKAPTPDEPEDLWEEAARKERPLQEALGDYSLGLRTTIDDLRKTVGDLRGKLDALRASAARTEGELALARSLNEQKDAALQAKDAEYARLRRRVTAGFTLTVTVLAVIALAAWLGGGDVQEDYRTYQAALSDKQRTIESLQAIMGATMIELPSVDPIEVRFTKEGDHYVRPVDDRYIDEVEAAWNATPRGDNDRLVAFLVSHASHDASSAYNAWVSANRASRVTAALSERDIFVGAMVAKELSGTVPALDDRVVHIHIARLTEDRVPPLAAPPSR